MTDETNDPLRGIQNSIENVIGTPTVLRRRRATQKDIQKELFEKIINILEGLQARTVIMQLEIGINLSSYDELFYKVVDALVEFHFGPEITELIFFYIYDRVSPEGTINELKDDKGNSYLLNNSSDLWELINKIELKNKKTKSKL